MNGLQVEIFSIICPYREACSLLTTIVIFIDAFTIAMILLLITIIAIFCKITYMYNAVNIY